MFAFTIMIIIIHLLSLKLFLLNQKKFLIIYHSTTKTISNMKLAIFFLNGVINNILE